MNYHINNHINNHTYISETVQHRNIIFLLAHLVATRFMKELGLKLFLKSKYQPINNKLISLVKEKQKNQIAE